MSLAIVSTLHIMEKVMQKKVLWHYLIILLHWESQSLPQAQPSRIYHLYPY